MVGQRDNRDTVLVVDMREANLICVAQERKRKYSSCLSTSSFIRTFDLARDSGGKNSLMLCIAVATIHFISFTMYMYNDG